MLRMMLFFILRLSGVKKFFLPTNKICVGLKLDDGLGARPKGYRRISKKLTLFYALGLD